MDDIEYLNNSKLTILSLSEQKSEIKKQKKWTLEEDRRLLALVEELKDKKVKWQVISKHFQSKTTPQCYSRYRQINPKINKGPWSKKEDTDLLYYISKYGKKWSLLSKLVKTRSSKQIRDRYLNCLDDKVKKTPFTSEEDKIILELIYKYGSNWSRIAKEVKGRTGDNIKNRFNWSIRHTLETQINFFDLSNKHLKLDKSVNFNRKSKFAKEPKKFKESSSSSSFYSHHSKERSKTLNKMNYLSSILFKIISLVSDTDIHENLEKNRSNSIKKIADAGNVMKDFDIRMRSNELDPNLISKNFLYSFRYY